MRSPSHASARLLAVAANGFWGAQFTRQGQIPMTQSVAILTGCAAGATESFVVTPFELVKIRMQDKMSTYKGPMDVVRQTIAKEGPLALYSGMEATFWRHVMWNGGYFGSIFQIRALLPKATSKSGELTNNFISGSIGGAIGTVLNTPCEYSHGSGAARRMLIPFCLLVDVVKSRIQMQNTGEWAFGAVLRTAREEGVGALYKGFAPKVLRLAPGGGVLLLGEPAFLSFDSHQANQSHFNPSVVEALSTVFRKQLGPPYI